MEPACTCTACTGVSEGPGERRGSWYLWGLQEGDYDQRLVTDWDNMIWPASLLLAELTDDMAFHDVVQVNPISVS